MGASNQKPGASLTSNELIVITVPKSLARLIVLVLKEKKQLNVMELLKIKFKEKCEVHALDFTLILFIAVMSLNLNLVVSHFPI